MTPSLTCPDPDASLAGLKDFQRRTVDRVYDRLYAGSPPASRFLVADEVGLGKTLVARGVIARALKQLWDRVSRIDIIYICSNADIARQNICRLTTGLPGQESVFPASRLTLLPVTVHNLQDQRVNFIALTPGTSFDLKSNLGLAKERALLYCLLAEMWDLRGAAPYSVLQGDTTRDYFRKHVEELQRGKIDERLAADYRCAIAAHMQEARQIGKPDLRERFDDLCQRFRRRKHIPSEDREHRAQLVGELRDLLARTCLRALEPDLIILDEFQRFKHLLDPEHVAGQLASQLFEYSDQHSSARVLLLSATPYKMYTLAQERDTDDHYRDFLATLWFLFGEQSTAGPDLEDCLQAYRHGLYELGSTGAVSDRLGAVRSRLESHLRSVMVRTERLAVAEDRDGMLAQVPPNGVQLTAGDLADYVALQRVADSAPGLHQRDVLEYWKTAPYLLNFMEDYELKRGFKGAVDSPTLGPEIADELARCRPMLFPEREWHRYKSIDPRNARLRALLAATVETGAWRLLWLPPCQPYHRLGGPFAQPGARNLTKRLVFSAWHVVPRVISALLSYAAERQMVQSFEEEPENSVEARRHRRPLLRFAQAEGRPTGMSTLGLMYPSLTLARLADPLLLAGECIGKRHRISSDAPAVRTLLAEAQKRIENRLAPLTTGRGATGLPDDNWYWAAPILLDLAYDAEGSHAWLSRVDLAGVWASHERWSESDEHSLWSAHVEEARQLATGSRLQALGRPPRDLARVLAEMALAAPGVVALRALLRITQHPEANNALRDAAAQIAWAFRTLFNVPEVTALLRGMDRREPYWRRVLDYCVHGCLQATLDEWFHVLKDLLGLRDRSSEEVSEGIAEGARSALTLRTTTVSIDRIEVPPRTRSVRLEHNTIRMRCRFALRYGDAHAEDTLEVTRPGQVREAFNSPFWPFVLATTSIGQEGLDFHPYCHAVVHWDLPSNPVDLEQREGRVHRYKGHAVRKNLARTYGRTAMADAAQLTSGVAPDPWERLFRAGTEARGPGDTDLVPFWVYAPAGGARIERHVLALPMSRDVERLAALRRSLAVYRMVFGQPRQEDMVKYLLEQLPEPVVAQALEELRIDLAPSKSGVSQVRTGG